MYHNFILVQKIDENADYKVFFAAKQYVNWTYETIRKPHTKFNNPMFPLVINDKEVEIQEKPKGRETSCFKISDNRIRFIDDYGVPEGFIICVTGPVGYMPRFIKFGHKPNINMNGYSHCNPGMFDFYVNATTKQASILVHTTQRSLFSMAIDFEKHDGSFDLHRRTNYYDAFDLTIALNAGKFEEVSKTEVRNILPGILETQSEQIVQVMNELINHLKTKQEESLPSNLRLNMASVFNSLLSSSSAAVTIVDSYVNNGSVGKMIKTLIEYFSH